MLIRIHQLRDRIYALKRNLEEAKLELKTEIENCPHLWVKMDGKPTDCCDRCGEFKNNCCEIGW